MLPSFTEQKIKALFHSIKKLIFLFKVLLSLMISNFETHHIFIPHAKNMSQAPEFKE